MRNLLDERRTGNSLTLIIHQNGYRVPRPPEDQDIYARVGFAPATASDGTVHMIHPWLTTERGRG